MSKKNTANFWVAMALLAALSLFSVLSFSDQGTEEGDKDRMALMVSKMTSIWQWINVVPSRDTSERVLKGINAAKDVGEDVVLNDSSGDANHGAFDLTSDKNNYNQGEFKIIKTESGLNLEVTDNFGEIHVFKLFHH